MSNLEEIKENLKKEAEYFIFLNDLPFYDCDTDLKTVFFIKALEISEIDLTFKRIEERILIREKNFFEEENISTFGKFANYMKKMKNKEEDNFKLKMISFTDKFILNFIDYLISKGYKVTTNFEHIKKAKNDFKNMNEIESTTHFNIKIDDWADCVISEILLKNNKFIIVLKISEKEKLKKDIEDFIFLSECFLPNYRIDKRDIILSRAKIINKEDLEKILKKNKINTGMDFFYVNALLYFSNYKEKFINYLTQKGYSVKVNKKEERPNKLTSIVSYIIEIEDVICVLSSSFSMIRENEITFMMIVSENKDRC